MIMVNVNITYEELFIRIQDIVELAMKRLGCILD